MAEGITFTTEEVAAGIAFLEKVAANRCFWPDDASMIAAHKTSSQWATELVITRGTGQTVEILLATYDGNITSFQGMWHIPGGYNKAYERDIPATVSRIARVELKTMVRYDGILDCYKWLPEECEGRSPLSLYCGCQLQGEITETKTLRYFSVHDLPENILEPQRRFIKANLVA